MVDDKNETTLLIKKTKTKKGVWDLAYSCFYEYILQGQIQILRLTDTLHVGFLFKLYVWEHYYQNIKKVRLVLCKVLVVTEGSGLLGLF